MRLAWLVFAAVLALSVAAGLAVEPGGHFAIESFFAFNAVYGLLACALLIFVAKVLGLALRRPDDYYEEGGD